MLVLSGRFCRRVAVYNTKMIKLCIILILYHIGRAKVSIEEVTRAFETEKSKGKKKYTA